MSGKRALKDALEGLPVSGVQEPTEMGGDIGNEEQIDAEIVDVVESTGDDMDEVVVRLTGDATGEAPENTDPTGKGVRRMSLAEASRVIENQGGRATTDARFESFVVKEGSQEGRGRILGTINPEAAVFDEPEPKEDEGLVGTVVKVGRNLWRWLKKH